ncbi:MAG: AlkA N-terminal domain-containing protein [Steroidobacteraceae bacterium]
MTSENGWFPRSTRRMVRLMSAPAPLREPRPRLNPSEFDRRVLDRARASRDPRFDGRFFVGVTSTGIYCRPVCPAPSPRRAHVRYFSTAAAAAEAGFRPCLRCRPEAAPGTPAWLGTSAVVRRALRLIDDGTLDDQSVDDFAARVGIGARHLHRLFVRHVGASPIAVVQTRRLHFAKRLLDETPLRMTEIALAAGFGSSRRFNDAFQRTYGRSPRELRKDGERAASNGSGAIRLRLAYRPPYDWPFVHGFLAARAIPGLERVDDGAYARTIALEGPAANVAPGHATLRVCPVAGRHELELSVHGAPASALFQIVLAARRVFDLRADPALTSRAFRGDPLLGPLVRRRPGLRVPGVWDPFECAVRAVLGQQVSVAAGKTLASRLVARAGRTLAAGPGDSTGGGRERDRLTHAFPTPEALAEIDLSGLGITGARIATIRTLARAIAERTLDFRAPADEVAIALEALRGIGPWTAHYIALRALGEPDAFPAADVVLRRMAAAGGQSLSARALAARAQSWRPWRSYAALHLWCAAEESRT